MPTYRIKGPDGKTYKVTAPEGATQEEILARVQQNAKEPWYEDFGEGFVTSGLETVYGLKDLMANSPISPTLAPRTPTPEQGVTDNERSRLKDWQQDAAQSGWGTAGRVTGELAQLAIPGGAGLKAARAAKEGSRLAKVLPLSADVTGSAAIGAARLPDEGETRAENAATEAAGALVGHGLERVGRGLLAGAIGREAANRLQDAGVQVTAGQKLGGLAQKWENNLALFPMIARPMDAARDKFDRTLIRTALRDAAPPQPGTLLSDAPKELQLPERHREAREVLKQAFEKNYEDAFTPINRMPQETVQQLGQIVQDSLPRLTEAESTILKRTIKDVNKIASSNPDASLAKVDKVLRDAITGSKEMRELDGALKSLQDTIRASQPAPNQKALQLLDSKYPKFVAIRNATGTLPASKRAGEITLDDLNAGARAAANKYTRGGETQPFMQFLDDAFETRGEVPGVIPTQSRRFIQAVPGFGVAGTINRRIAGEGIGQKQARKILESELAKQLRYGVSGARLGAAYED